MKSLNFYYLQIYKTFLLLLAAIGNKKES
jgi:hypothetical protein